MKRSTYGSRAAALFFTAALSASGQTEERWPAAIYKADAPPATPAVEDLPRVGKISRHGIT